MKQVYISGALTNSHEKSFYEALGEVVSQNSTPPLNPYIPHQHTDPILRADITPCEIYEKDKSTVENSHLVILCANYPSFGTGMEAQIAAANDIPVLILRKNSVKVSRMLLGAPTVAEVISYESEPEALEKVSGFLKTFFK